MSSLPRNFECNVQPMSSGLRRTTSNGNVTVARVAQLNDALNRVPFSRIRRGTDSGIMELFNSPSTGRSEARGLPYGDYMGSTVSIADSTTRVTTGFNGPDVTPSTCSSPESANSVDVCGQKDVFRGTSNVLVSNELRNCEVSSDDEENNVAISIRRSEPLNILSRPKRFIKKYESMDPQITGIDSVCAEIQRVCSIYNKDEYPYNLSAYDVWAQQNGDL